MKLIKTYWSHALSLLFSSGLLVFNAYFVFKSAETWAVLVHALCALLNAWCIRMDIRSIQRERDYQAELASFLKKYDFSKPILIYDGKYPPNRSTHPITDTTKGNK